MSQLRTRSLVILCSLAILAPASVMAQRFNSCEQLRSQLARQAEAMRQQQAGEMSQCETSFGSHSQSCSDLQERQKEDLRQLKAYTHSQLRGCDGAPLMFIGLDHYYHRIHYGNAIYYHHHRHHYVHGAPNGHNGARVVGTHIHNHESTQQGHIGLSAESHERLAGHVGGWGHSSGGGGAHVAGIHAGAGGYSLGHGIGYGRGYSEGHGIAYSGSGYSGGHTAGGYGGVGHSGGGYSAGGYSGGGHAGGYSGGSYSGGGGYSGGHSGGGGFSGGSSAGSSSGGSSGGSSSGGGGHSK